MSEKTEQPTPRRLRKAREEGDVPVSAALSQGVGFAAALALVPAAIASTVATVSELLTSAVDGHTLTAPEFAASVLKLSVPLIAVAAFGATAASAAQSGGLFALERLAPRFERLNPFSGLKSLFSVQRVFSLARALMTALVLMLLSWIVLRAALSGLLLSLGELTPTIAVAARASRRLAWYAAALGLALGVVDLLIVRRAWLKRWMMTKDEIRRESRENEGDPELKAARRRAHQQMLTSAAVHAVKDASIVIVNPTHLAIALRYQEEEDNAPRVLAQGEGDLARRIVEAAHAYGIPVVRDVPIARALAELEVGDEIPEALYEAVAAILSEAWSAERGPAEDEPRY